MVLAGLLALAVAAVTPSTASAGPEPGAKPRGFRLFARSLGAITINRVYCGLATTGEVCVDSTNSSTIGGGYWPKGTADQYVFNSGLQLAGIVGGTKPGNPWGGDTTGAFFFDPKGTTQHGEQVEPIYNATSLDDQANWPQAAFVPSGDAAQELFNPLLRGRLSASQGDVWWLSWEGNPGQNAGRSHPLGIVVEQRGMGWNFPAGNEDILYFIYTFYNVTSLDPAAYANIRPGLREIMIQKAQDFHSLNNAAFGITLPQEGYSIENMFAAFGADMDVADAGDNYSSVVLPFALGHTYPAEFNQPAGWTFDPGIFAPPFFPAAGFVGVKYLRSPTGAGEIQLFSNTINGGQFGDAANTKQLYRYLSGNISQAAGDAACTYDPVDDRLCFVNNDDPADMRFFQSSTPLSLAPGEFGSIVVAYIFAAPYKPASYTPGNLVPPGDPRRLTSVTQLNTVGANLVDTLAGLLDFDDANGNNIPEQNEFTVATGSLLGKALVAQAVFDNRFLLPFAPDAPEFFLVPGDNQVTVLWRPSPSETGGDPFFSIASTATIIPEGGGDPVVNPLYDPNYRQFDVEGYRIYRGRVDAPNALTLLAQFDYAGTEILDFQGQINPVNTCAPELNIFTECPEAYIPAEFQPGVTRTVSHAVPLVGEIVQVVVPGTRAELADGTAIILAADTAVTGEASGFPELSDTGVPFVYVDNTVRNNFRYFYAVTAFDVNSFQSGPSSLESPRITKSVTPRVNSANAELGLVTSLEVFGRGVSAGSPSDPLPTIDPATGVFSGPFPPANGWNLEFTGYVAQLVQGEGAITVRLDSIQMGSAYNNVPGVYFVTIQPGTSAESQAAITLPMANTGGATQTAVLNFAGQAVDPGQAQNFGVATDFVLGAGLTAQMPADYWMTVQSRGCVNGAEGFTNANDENECSYNGSRWFEGTVETAAHPTSGNMEVNDFGFAPAAFTTFNNAGVLPGVTTVYEARSYVTTQTTWRNVEGIMGFAARAADLRVYWGANGVVDSVIDVTHNVVVPFDTAATGGWGFLNASNTSGAGSDDGRPGVVSIFDFGCVYPIRSFSTIISCTAGTEYNLAPVAELSPIVLAAGSPLSANAGKAPEAEPGFLMYIAGHLYSFVMPALPADGTVWTMRAYTGGGLTGGQGAAGDEGPYVYNEVRPRPFTAVGAELRLVFDATNQLNTPDLATLDDVHTVPDPYYVTSEFEQTTDNKVIKFVNLPNAATIRIYSSSGVLVDVIEHNSISGEGAATWNVRNRNNQVVASGVYFYHIEAGDARKVGRFTIVNFAQ
ncbi:MAG TPA: T9SS type A sorting domain-containing protein [Gemmatimonadales bacterium]